MGNLMPNPSLSKDSRGTVVVLKTSRDKCVHTFPKDISLKMDVIV